MLKLSCYHLPFTKLPTQRGGVGEGGGRGGGEGGKVGWMGNEICLGRSRKAWVQAENEVNMFETCVFQVAKPSLA